MCSRLGGIRKIETSRQEQYKNEGRLTYNWKHSPRKSIATKTVYTHLFYINHLYQFPNH